MPDTVTDHDIEAILMTAPRERWTAVWNALDEVAAEDVHAIRPDAEVQVFDGGTHFVEFEGVVNSDALNRLIGALYELGAVVPFDWFAWDGLQRYRTAEAIEAAPVADAVRLMTALLRQDRMEDGTVDDAITNGTFTAALRRLRRWHETERTLP